MKKLLSSIGVGIGLLYSYYLGYKSGFRAAQGTPYTSQESVSVEVDEDEDNRESEDDEDNEGDIECKDDDCERTFKSERGMNIHYGQLHADDDE